MEPVSAVIGVVIFLIGVGVGRIQRRRRAPQGGQQPICGCVHHLSMHNPETGHCHGKVELRITPPSGSTYAEWHPCPCRRYIGPQPLTDVWAAPLAIDHDKTNT